MRGNGKREKGRDVYLVLLVGICRKNEWVEEEVSFPESAGIGLCYHLSSYPSPGLVGGQNGAC